MNSDEYRNFLLSNLQGSRSVSGGKEVLTRCRYCPDSSNPNHAHFYISVPQNEDELSFFNCYKCHSCGIVTNNTLLEWGIYDPQVGIRLIQHNKKIFRNPKNLAYRDDIVYNIKYTHITKDDLSKYKLDYINNRLGLSLTYDDCIKLKIVLNLKDLLYENHLKGTRHPNIIEQLDSSFIGFLSVNNAFINMRKVVENKNLYQGDRKSVV